MVKKKLKKKRGEVKNPWFRKRKGLLSADLGWGWIPISWQGGVMVLIFVALIVFSAFYFRIGVVGGEVLKFLTTFFLALVVFSIIARRKTK
jgi:hypothetical protein